MPTPQINIRRAQQLCTATEFALVRAAQPRSITALTAAQIAKKIDRARTLRDKWKDQAKKSRRRAQEAKGHRGADGAARSREKSELFGLVLAVFEARARELRRASAPAKPAKSAALKKKKKKKKKTTKKKSAKKSKKKKAAAKKSSGAAPARKAAKTARALVGAAGKKKSAKKQRPSPSEDASHGGSDETLRLVLHPGLVHRAGDLRPGGAAESVPFVERDAHASGDGESFSAVGRALEPAVIGQIRANTAAKQRRIDVSGLRSRTKGRVSAQVRRAQAKRDRKGGQGSEG